jgi:hypothetical protein
MMLESFPAENPLHSCPFSVGQSEPVYLPNRRFNYAAIWWQKYGKVARLIEGQLLVTNNKYKHSIGRLPQIECLLIKLHRKPASALK